MASHGKYWSRGIGFLLGAALVAIAGAVPKEMFASNALVYSWAAPVNGAFHDPDRWAPVLPPGPPGPDDTAVFGFAEPYHVGVFSDTRNQLLQVYGDWVTLNLNGTTYSVSELQIAGGRLAKALFTPGRLVVSDSGTTSLPYDGIFIGVGGGSGDMSITDGGWLDGGYDSIWVGADADSTGTVRISGEGSKWSIWTGNIGHAGSGIVQVEDRAQLASDVVRIGVEAGSAGLVRLSGPGVSWGSTTLTVGIRGDGAVLVEDEARVGTFVRGACGASGVGCQGEN
jgi:T5SS/PEP-CTERM-associated repeat protein